MALTDHIDTNRFRYTVTVAWPGGFQPKYWEELCLWAFRNVGLMGDKFIVVAGENYTVHFIFEEEKDSVLFALRWV